MEDPRLLANTLESHVFHHFEQVPITVSVKAERNSKGWNYEATVHNALSVAQAIATLRDATNALEAEYGGAKSL